MHCIYSCYKKVCNRFSHLNFQVSKLFCLISLSVQMCWRNRTLEWKASGYKAGFMDISRTFQVKCYFTTNQVLANKGIINCSKKNTLGMLYVKICCTVSYSRDVGMLNSNWCVWNQNSGRLVALFCWQFNYMLVYSESCTFCLLLMPPRAIVV